MFEIDNFEMVGNVFSQNSIHLVISNNDTLTNINYNKL